MKKFRGDRRLSLYLVIVTSILILTGIGIFIYYNQNKDKSSKQSNYEIYTKSLPSIKLNYLTSKTTFENSYRPISTWMGRLILPPKEQRQTNGSVLFEVSNADTNHQNLVGKVVNLQLRRDAQTQDYIRAVTRDVRFTKEVESSKKQGNLHPDRLDNLAKVSPLESLAGARTLDDVTVMLKDPVVERTNPPSLTIAEEPVQITGNIYSLVTVVKREVTNNESFSDAVRDRFLVRHFNKTTKQFNGKEEIIRIPQAIADINGIARSTNQSIEKSPLNPFGWYVYGGRDADGNFVAQAIAPRAILRLQPDEVRLGIKSGIAYINRENWKNTTAQKGTAKTVLLDSQAKQNQDAVSYWKEGERAIVLHTFGGIGGEKGESAPLGVVTGHFAYGIATVVRDPFTDELNFDIEYRQIYAHNPDGIISGTVKWSSYMGDLQRGWLGNRPVSDAIVKLDAITQDYDFDGIKLSPISEFTKTLNIMAARYRIGDGTGASTVNPAASCVQDSNQALYVTIKRMEERVQSDSRIQDWLRRHPNNPQSLRFQHLGAIAQSLEENLAPLGIVRSDWKKNATDLVGTHPSGGLFSTLFRTATTWRTMLPRRAQDEITTILLKHGAALWFIRTNQVGGFDPTIKPTAPTALLGHRTK